MTWFSLCSAMIINNTNIFIISTWVLMFVCMWEWKRTKSMPDSPSVREVLWGGWKHTLPSAAPEAPPFPTNTDLLSTVLYLELCKLFSCGTGNWVTLIMDSKLATPQQNDLSYQTCQGVSSGCFSKHLPCPGWWIRGFVSLAWKAQEFCRGHKPNPTVLSGLCSLLRFTPLCGLRRKMWICLWFVAFLLKPTQSSGLFGVQQPQSTEEHTKLTPTQHSTSWRARLDKALFGKLLFWILHCTKEILLCRVFFWMRNFKDIFKFYFFLKLMYISEHYWAPPVSNIDSL